MVVFFFLNLLPYNPYSRKFCSPSPLLPPNHSLHPLLSFALLSLFPSVLSVSVNHFFTPSSSDICTPPLLYLMKELPSESVPSESVTKKLSTDKLTIENRKSNRNGLIILVSVKYRDMTFRIFRATRRYQEKVEAVLFIENDPNKLSNLLSIKKEIRAVSFPSIYFQIIFQSFVWDWWEIWHCR